MTLMELTQQKLDELAAEYRMKGYAVTLNPAGSDVPEAFRAFQADLVATSSSDNV
ncbi:MAG: hypothetical protein ACXWH7_14635, partial [Thermoanaerobaculia bacterium]